jgi:hypothetical protein
MTIERLQCPSFKGLTRFNGFELLAWDFNPSWAMRLSISTQIEFTNRIIHSRVGHDAYRSPPTFIPQSLPPKCAANELRTNRGRPSRTPNPPFPNHHRPIHDRTILTHPRPNLGLRFGSPKLGVRGAVNPSPQTTVKPLLHCCLRLG